MSFSEAISPFFGRCALVWFFATAVMNILNDWHHVAAELTAKNIPAAPLVLLVAVIFIVMGAVSLLLGYHARHGAVLLFALTIMAAWALHPFWQIGDVGARAAEFQIFARDIAIAGGLLLIVGMGAGPFAVDNVSGGKGGGKRH